MIDSKDLQIGDLVMTPYGTHKVDTIYGDTGRVSADLIELDISELDAIPLTPEIMEKNFEKKTFYGIYDDYFDLDIREYSDGLYIVTYHSCEFNIPNQTIHLSWIHELQHFMRHCGIEKEIRL